MSAGERGSVSLFVAVLGLALVATGGLVFDGAAGLAAARRAQNLAEEAARAGVAGGSAPGSSGLLSIDPLAAQRSALAYLVESGVEGEVSALPQRVVVVVRLQEPTSLLRIVGVEHLGVEGVGEARPATGVESEGR